MALPNKPFIINYNARDYNPSTYTIPKHPDQTLDLDAYFNVNGSAITKHDEYITTNSSCTQHTFSSTSANPFNRDSNDKALTIIYRIAGGTYAGADDNVNIFSNRSNSNSSYNYMARKTAFHVSSAIMAFKEPNTAHTTVVRVQSGGSCERFVVEDKTNYYASASSISYGNKSVAFGLCAGFGDRTTSEVVASIDFYWIYISNQALTDEEINQVIAFNTKTFEVDTDEINAPHQGSSYTVTLNSDLPWSLMLTDTFFTVTPDSGMSGTTLLTVNVEQNFGNARSGHFYIVDDELAEIEVTINQEKAPILVPFKSIYRGGNRIT